MGAACGAVQIRVDKPCLEDGDAGPGTAAGSPTQEGAQRRVGRGRGREEGRWREARAGGGRRGRQEVAKSPRLCPGRAHAAPRSSPLTRPPVVFHREDAVAPGCKASGRGSRVTHLLGYPTQNVSRSLRRKYAPPPCGGPENVALAPCTAAAACEAGPSPVYVKVKSAEPADCAEGPVQCKNGLMV